MIYRIDQEWKVQLSRERYLKVAKKKARFSNKIGGLR